MKICCNIFGDLTDRAGDGYFGDIVMFKYNKNAKDEKFQLSFHLGKDGWNAHWLFNYRPFCGKEIEYKHTSQDKGLKNGK